MAAILPLEKWAVANGSHLPKYAESQQILQKNIFFKKYHLPSQAVEFLNRSRKAFLFLLTGRSRREPHAPLPAEAARSNPTLHLAAVHDSSSHQTIGHAHCLTASKMPQSEEMSLFSSSMSQPRLFHCRSQKTTGTRTHDRNSDNAV